MKAQTRTQAQSARPPGPGRHEEALPERVHDSYKLLRKLREPTVCPTCDAVYHHGHWQWSSRPANADEVICSACHRIADNFPAGYLYITGDFASLHRDELLKLLRHHEARATAEHPMARIMAIDEAPGEMVVTTTDVHLARDLGVAAKAALRGTLQLKYSKDENLLRAYWHS